VREVAPQYRDVWLDALQKCQATLQGDALGDHEYFSHGSVANLIHKDHPHEFLAAVGALREHGFVRGWNHLQLTDLGHMMCAALWSSSNVLAYCAFHEEIARMLGSSRHEDAVAAVKCASDSALPASLTIGPQCLCKGCGKIMEIRIQRSNPFLYCAACSSVRTPAFRGSTVFPWTNRLVYRWCSRDADTKIHDAIEDPKGLLKLRCKGCSHEYLE
jgi:hypothetical protein